MTTPIVRVRAWWDDQQGGTPGWYAETYRRDADGAVELADDSVKVWFPVDLDIYAEDDGARVSAALEDAFPDAEVEVTQP